jgi:TatD DNase family protein
MPTPGKGDLIDIHTHDSVLTDGVFAVENLMIHEGRLPDGSAKAFSVGIHPWFLNEEEVDSQLAQLAKLAADERVVAIGEAGYDRRKGPDLALQERVFEEQARMADELSKPLIIHCVKGWDELWASRLRLRPRVPWIIHGFNGSIEQAGQLIAGGMYLSLWIKSVLNGSLDRVIRELPSDRIFLETDGFGIALEEVYKRAAQAAVITPAEFASAVSDNYLKLFSELLP